MRFDLKTPAYEEALHSDDQWSVKLTANVWIIIIHTYITNEQVHINKMCYIIYNYLSTILEQVKQFNYLGCELSLDGVQDFDQKNKQIPRNMRHY
jgi:hypothetical protein